MGKDYYQILGLGKGATEADLKKAFRELAHKHHPDKAGGDEAKFKEINEAYQVLSDPKKRAQYDQYGQTFDQGGGPGFGGFGGFQGGVNFDMGDLGEMFGDVFGFGGVRSQGSGVRGQSRGRDIRMDVRLKFHEAAFGVEKEIELYKPVACADCSGTGIPPGAKMLICTHCKGQGRVREVRRTILGNIETVATCAACRGAGNVPEKTCATCKGVGATREKRHLKFKVPAGIDDGETIRLAGEGEAGERGAPAGDLYLDARVQPDPRFARDGYDLRSEIEIGFSEAALGATKRLETLDGETELKIPAGIQSGEEIRLRAKGVPYLQRSGRGDHYVTVRLKTPEHLSRKAKDLLRELGEEGV